MKQSNKLIQDFLSLGYKLNDDGSVLGRNGKLLKLHVGGSTYYQVNTTKNNIRRTFLLHRLIASKFIPNPLNLAEVNHKDGNKLNNRIENLEWVSRSQNIQHGVDTGLIPAPWKGKTGKNNPKSKAVFQLDKLDNIIAEFGSAYEAARLTGICYGTISNVLINRGQTAGGFKWKYK